MTFELITKFNRPVAAIIPGSFTSANIASIYVLLPSEAVMNPVLARRWAVAAVLCTPDWAQAQLRRQPMLKPKGLKLSLGD